MDKAFLRGNVYPGLKLFFSNRLEILAEKLAKELKTPLASPLEKEIIVVQSKGMERWVSMQLAHYHGICANCRFPFPNAILNEIFRTVIPNLSEEPSCEPEIMTWRIMKVLPHCLKKPGFESLKAYLENDDHDLKRFQLSERIAQAFDQYLIYRPEMILHWEKGRESHWQAVLWRMVVSDGEKPHWPAIREAFLKRVKRSLIEIKNLPERISVFGISALPPFHMEVIAEIARFIPVNLFLMNPCREYWGDIVSDREVKKIRKRSNKEKTVTEILYLEKGNSLLASLGILGRDFFDLIYSFDYEEHDCFKEPFGSNMLASIQSDILNLRERGKEKGKKAAVPKADTSVQIHSCHSPMREIEVLHDNLLAMFEEDSDLLPKDILVMTPDIEPYTPFIEAVFDAPGDDSGRIPYSIADRSLKNESNIINIFLAILGLCGSRFGASQVINIFESRAVHTKFGLSEKDLDTIKRWVDQTGIRWGIDEKTRRQMGLPGFSENTWKFGLERLLLGYAMPSQEKKLFQGILPYGHIEGHEVEVLGNFLRFTEQLFSYVISLAQARPINKWVKTLIEILEYFFSSDEDSEREIKAIRDMLNDLAGIQEKSRFDAKIKLPVIMSYLRHKCERKGFGFGFLTGGVTFCTMLPMRSIPFKVICLMGMNNEAYPRESKRLNFDLLAQHPKPGDRSRRNDDRYLFLEALLSARRKFYVSYVGQSIQDNSPIPPSVVVSELMDYLEQGFMFSGKSILDHVVTKHRLQAFNPKYFKKNGKLFSYSENNYRAAQCSLEQRHNPLPFVSQGLSKPDETWRNIDIKLLDIFFANPARFLLNRRLGIYLEERALFLREKEPFDLKGIERYKLEQELLEKSLEGYDLKNLYPVIKASGRIPLGTIGGCLYEIMSEEIERFAATVRSFSGDEAFKPIDINLNIDAFVLGGNIKGVFNKGLIHYRYTKIKPKDHLKLWIHHLILNSIKTDTYPQESVLIGMNHKGLVSVWTYPPVENSKEILKELLEIYWEGLSRPLQFFPESSWEYACSVLERSKSESQAISNALDKWEGNDFNPGESEDVYYQLCFREGLPLDAEFRKTAKKIFAPILTYRKEIKHAENKEL